MATSPSQMLSSAKIIISSSVKAVEGNLLSIKKTKPPKSKGLTSDSDGLEISKIEGPCVVEYKDLGSNINPLSVDKKEKSVLENPEAFSEKAEQKPENLEEENSNENNILDGQARDYEDDSD